MKTRLVILCAAALLAISAQAGGKPTCGGPKQPPCGKPNIADGAAKGQAVDGVVKPTGGGNGGGPPPQPGQAVKGEGVPGMGTGGGGGGGGGGGSTGPACAPYPGRPCPTSTAAAPGGQTGSQPPH